MQYEDIGAYEVALASDLEDRRYDVARTTIFALVRERAAFVTTTDSGFVIIRGTKTPFKEHRLWFFEQGEEKDEWLATGLVTALGDSTSGSYDGPTTNPDRDVVETLIAEASEWQDGDASGAIGHLSDGYVGLDCYDKFAPASWLIVFADPTELQEWLSRRLELTRYTIERNVLHTSVGQNGQEALALTQDDMSTSYVKGTAVHSAKPYVLWTLSRRSGDWEITRKLYQLRVP